MVRVVSEKHFGVGKIWRCKAMADYDIGLRHRQTLIGIRVAVPPYGH